MNVIRELFGKAEFKKANFSTAIIYTGTFTFTDDGLIHVSTTRGEKKVFRTDQLEQLDEIDRGDSSDSIYD